MEDRLDRHDVQGTVPMLAAARRDRGRAGLVANDFAVDTPRPPAIRRSTAARHSLPRRPRCPRVSVGRAARLISPHTRSAEVPRSMVSCSKLLHRAARKASPSPSGSCLRAASGRSTICRRWNTHARRRRSTANIRSAALSATIPTRNAICSRLRPAGGSERPIEGSMERESAGRSLGTSGKVARAIPRTGRSRCRSICLSVNPWRSTSVAR